MAVKLGFIGFGIMGERLLRAALAHDPGVVTVVGIYDPSPAAAGRLAAIDPGLTVHATPQAMIAAADAVHIASPPASHLAYLAACAEAGRAALCEKPLAIDVAAARQEVPALTVRGLRAAVNFPFASSFAVDAIDGWRREGLVGEPRQLDIVTRFATWPRPWQNDAAGWLDRRAEGGFVREVVSHFLFLARRQLGPLQLLDARTHYPQVDRSERAVAARLSAGGVPVTLTGEVGTIPLDDHNTWTLTGSAGCVRLRDWSIAEREVAGQWQAPPDALANERMRPLVLARQLDKVAAMTRGEPTTLATLDEALEVQTIVEAILQRS